MGKIVTFKKSDLRQRGPRRSSSPLASVTLSGVVVPCGELADDGCRSHFKLACPSGMDYVLITDEEWRAILSDYRWKHVQVKGLLNLTNRALIPQRVFPEGPNAEREQVVDLSTLKNRELAKKVASVITELVFVPAALLAVMA